MCLDRETLSSSDEAIAERCRSSAGILAVDEIERNLRNQK